VTLTVRQRLDDYRWRTTRLLGVQWTEAARERLASRHERFLLEQSRGGRDVCWVEPDDESEPLVTVRIATYNRGQMVVDRAISSALRQSYKRLDILVVGDNCDAETARAVESVTDERLRFVNLPYRGMYPTDRKKLWMVAGAAPMNAALRLARGAWIAPCDDDDELTDDHVEVLLAHAKKQRLEMVYSKTKMEVRPGEWSEIGTWPLRHGHISHGSVLYSAGLRFLQHSESSWRMNEPADWNMWRRMRRIGVRMGFLDRVTFIHHLEAYRRTTP
jgi:glycosyltransferase involved in cell wall biosynthesis